VPGADTGPRHPTRRPRQRLSRVVLTLLTALMITVGVAVPGRAASAGAVNFRAHCFTDTTSSRAEYFDLLGSLRVIRGTSGIGGPCRPEADVTRAEFAVMVFRLLALERAYEPPTPSEPLSEHFTDAADIPVWAADSVAICVALDIIAGIPDGRGVAFWPNRTIMGAEAAAMLLRALGNDSSITYGWPAGYIYRAAETELFSSDVDEGDWRFITPLAPVKREQMAYLLRNALYCQRGYTRENGGDITYSRPSIGSLLTSYVTVVEADLNMRSLTGLDGRSYRLAASVVGMAVDSEKDLVGRRLLCVRNVQGALCTRSNGLRHRRSRHSPGERPGRGKRTALRRAGREVPTGCRG